MNMKKVLLMLSVMLLAFGSFAKSGFEKVNTVYSNIPVKLIIKQDSTFSVIVDEIDENYVHYEVVNDTMLKITNKGFLYYNEETEPTLIKIKTPRTLNVECSRYLKIDNTKN